MAFGERLRFVIPNLITAIGLFFGLMAIFRCLAGDHVSASWWIVWCVLIDKLDGFAARRLGAASDFGVQMDSLSDLVTFGVAPAVLAVSASSGAAGALAMAAAAAYAVAAALRLARFNVAFDEEADLFQGFPTTVCGGVVSISFLVAARHGMVEGWVWGAPLLMILLALLMVSNVPVPKIKARKSRVVNIFMGINLVASYVVGAARVWPEYLLAVIAVYFVGGGVYMIFVRPRAPDRQTTST